MKNVRFRVTKSLREEERSLSGREREGKRKALRKRQMLLTWEGKKKIIN